MYCIIPLFTHKRKFVPDIAPLWLKNREKNRNQRVNRGGLMCGGAYMRGAYTWSNTGVKEKGGLICGGLYAGGLIGGEIRYMYRCNPLRFSCGIGRLFRLSNNPNPSFHRQYVLYITVL